MTMINDKICRNFVVAVLMMVNRIEGNVNDGNNASTTSTLCILTTTRSLHPGNIAVPDGHPQHV